MSWRPKGWEEIVKAECYDGDCVYREVDTFEAGVDAILKSLKEEAIHIYTAKGWEYLKETYESWLHSDKVGYIVFIPEEKNETIQT